MDSPATYFHWGFILISMPNLLVIAGMIVLFALALGAHPSVDMAQLLHAQANRGLGIQ
jgi:hypothetical protein